MGCCCYTAIAALLHCLQVVCDFCHEHLEANKQAYADPRLHLIYNDAREELERYEGKFDVIIGDLADPVDGGPCYQVICLGPDVLPFRQVLGAVVEASRPGMLQSLETSLTSRSIHHGSGHGSFLHRQTSRSCLLQS